MKSPKKMQSLIWVSTAIMIVAGFLVSVHPASAQAVSPLQTGHYMPAFSHVRDMGKPPPGFFVLLYNYYAFTDTYVDRDGNKFSTIPLDQIDPELPPVDLAIKLTSFATVPAFFWASPFEILGATWLIGTTPLYSSSTASFITESRGGTIDSEYNTVTKDRVSGFGDLYVQPLGLCWGFNQFDLTAVYGFTAPTGRYTPGADDNVGLGFWTHQVQAWGNYYPVEDQSTALVLGLTYELSGDLKGEDFNPGNRFSLEWGISQYLSERLELAVMGGHNWQVTEDRGSDVYWDPSYFDRKSTLAFTAGYWVWPGRMQITGKYAFDFAVRQRFKTNFFMLNLTFITNALTGSN
jgi:hypothetical protein